MHRVHYGSLKFPTYAPYTTVEGKEINLLDIINEELRRFPRGRHDDMIDCLAQLLAVEITGTDIPVHQTNDGYVETRTPRNPKAKQIHTTSKKWA